jgi:hypothetical protein
MARIRYSRGHYQPPKPNKKLQLPWGSEAPEKDTTPLDKFIDYATNDSMNPALVGEVKNVLIYWNRGDLTTGDEAKMVAMGLPNT